MSGPAPESIRARILRRCGHADGASRANIRWLNNANGSRDDTLAALDALVAEGAVHRFAQPSASNFGRGQVRFFVDAAAGEKWAASPAAPKHAKKPAPTPRQALRVVKQPQPRALQKPEGPVIVPAHVKVQRLPSAPVYSRHQLPPGERVVGGWASLGPGRYLEDRP